MTRPTPVFLPAALGLLLAGCAATTTTAAREPESTGGEAAALAATFRHLFADNASALKSNAATYCIGTGTSGAVNDPDPELIAALADVRPAVAPASACKADVRVVDAQGRPSLLFTLRTVECDGRNNCVFEGGYYEGNLSASSTRYRARFGGGRWQVTQEGPIAIS